MLAFHGAQHAQESAVRLAIGATPAGLLALLIRRGLVLLAIGLVLGIPGAIVMERGMSALLYGVTPADPSRSEASSCCCLRPRFWLARCRHGARCGLIRSFTLRSD